MPLARHRNAHLIRAAFSKTGRTRVICVGTSIDTFGSGTTGASAPAIAGRFRRTFEGILRRYQQQHAAIIIPGQVGNDGGAAGMVCVNPAGSSISPGDTFTLGGATQLYLGPVPGSVSVYGSAGPGSWQSFAAGGSGRCYQVAGGSMWADKDGTPGGNYALGDPVAGKRVLVKSYHLAGGAQNANFAQINVAATFGGVEPATAGSYAALRDFAHGGNFTPTKGGKLGFVECALASQGSTLCTGGQVATIWNDPFTDDGGAGSKARVSGSAMTHFGTAVDLLDPTSSAPLSGIVVDVPWAKGGGLVNNHLGELGGSNPVWQSGSLDWRYGEEEAANWLSTCVPCDRHVYRVQIGQNDSLDQASYKAAVRKICYRLAGISRLAGVDDVTIELVSTYRATGGGLKYSGYAQACAKLAEENSALIACLDICNQLEDDGRYSGGGLPLAVDSNTIGTQDNVHPNFSLMLEVGRLEDSIIRSAVGGGTGTPTAADTTPPATPTGTTSPSSNAGIALRYVANMATPGSDWFQPVTQWEAFPAGASNVLTRQGSNAGPWLGTVGGRHVGGGLVLGQTDMERLAKSAGGTINNKAVSIFAVICASRGGAGAEQVFLDSNSGRLMLGIDADGHFRVRGTGAAGTAAFRIGAAPEAVIVTFEATQATVYRRGFPALVIPWTAATASTSNVLSVLARADGTEQWRGGIYELVTINGLLRDDERESLFTYAEAAYPLPPTKPDSTIVCVGADRMAGRYAFADHSIPQRVGLQLHRRARAHQFARAGDTIANAISRWSTGPAEIMTRESGVGRDVLVIDLGSTELLSGSSAATVYTALLDLIKLARTTGFVTVVCTQPILVDSSWNSGTITSRVAAFQAFNAWARDNAGVLFDDVADIAALADERLYGSTAVNPGDTAKSPVKLAPSQYTMTPQASTGVDSGEAAHAAYAALIGEVCSRVIDSAGAGTRRRS